MTFGAFSQRIVDPGFNPLILPSGNPWAYLWDLSQQVTLSSGDVSAVQSLAPPTNHNLTFYLARPAFSGTWRNGQAAVVPSGTGLAGKALQVSNTTPLCPGVNPYSLAIVGQWPVLDATGEAFRIPIQGMGGPTFDAAPLYAVRSAGIWQLNITAPLTVTANADISSWSNRPFIALVSIVGGAASRVDVQNQGLALFTATGLNSGTPSGMGGTLGEGVRIGSGGTAGTGASGVFNSPLGLIGGLDAIFSAADRAYLLAGWSSRFTITP